MYQTRILLDSISPAGRRLTTWELTYPRMVHAELMTHRLFSRNSASSRAIPNEKLRQRVKDDPALPVWWGKNQTGMQAREELTGEALERVKAKWLRARDLMLEASEDLARDGLHKQLCNRLIEPWMFITVIVSATTFTNWFHLRNHWQAQPEIAWVAADMYQKYLANKPRQLNVGDWHLPLFDGTDHTEEDWATLHDHAFAMPHSHPDWALHQAKKISTGRVARVTLLTHEGRRDLVADIDLHDKLLAGQVSLDPLHMSPFEHIAQCLEDPNQPSGNFRGWFQYRKEIPNEHFGEVLP